MKILSALVLLGASAGSAVADDGSPSQTKHRWGVGLRAVSQNLSNDSDDDALHMGGGGLHVRWRFAPRWSAELSFEGLRADEHDGAYQRELSSSHLIFGYHFTPYRRWDWFLLAGIGGTDDTVTYRKADGTMAEETAEEVNFLLGAGVERRWTHFGLGVDLRAVGFARKDDEQPEGYDPATDFRAIPSGQHAGQIDVHFTYYF
jgi:hypothetical protein